MPYEDEILNDLTDEERAALEESDGGTTGTLGESLDKAGVTGDDDDKDDKHVDTGAGKGKTGEEGDDADADRGNDKDKAGDTGGADATGNGDKPGADADADATGTADEPGDKPAPLLVVDMPENAEARLKEFSDKKANLLEQHENGDITTREYHEQLEALNRDERKLEREIDRAQTAADMNAQQEKNAWQQQIDTFTQKTHPEYSTSTFRWQALDLAVKQIAAKPEAASWSGAKVLAEAHKLVEADLGAVPGKPADQSAADDKRTDKQKLELTAANRPLKGSKAEAPKTLRDVPAAAPNEVDDGRFAALDRLQATDPEAHEERLMKMSDADRDAYLARA